MDFNNFIGISINMNASKPIRIKIIRRQEEQTKKVKGLMEMFKADRFSSSDRYQPLIGASSDLEAYKTQKVKGHLQMFLLSERIR